MDLLEFYRKIPFNLLLNLGLPLDCHQLTMEQKELFLFLSDIWSKKDQQLERVNELERLNELLVEENIDLRYQLEDLEASIERPTNRISEAAIKEQGR